MRIIAEIHNDSDEAVDCPTVGLRLPELSNSVNYGWANPVSSVLHPHTSACLIGVAPEGLTSEAQFSSSEWTICNDLERYKVAAVEEWRLEVTYKLEILQPMKAKALVTISNLGSAVDRVFISGLVRDDDERICGTTITGLVTHVASGSTIETGFTINPELEYISNPFNLIGTTKGISFDFQVQPAPPVMNTGCDIVLPWNQPTD